MVLRARAKQDIGVEQAIQAEYRSSAQLSQGAMKVKINAPGNSLSGEAARSLAHAGHRPLLHASRSYGSVVGKKPITDAGRSGRPELAFVLRAGV
jgi:hypothetical protein